MKIGGAFEHLLELEQNTLVKKAIRTHERKQLEEKIQVMEEDFHKNNSHKLF